MHTVVVTHSHPDHFGGAARLRAEIAAKFDAIVSFAPLDEEIILRVVDKFLMQLEDQLHEKKVDALFTDALRKHLAKHGFDPLMGARPMQRLIQDTVRAFVDERDVEARAAALREQLRERATQRALERDRGIWHER